MKILFAIYKFWKIRQLLRVIENLSKFKDAHFAEVQKQIYDIRIEVSILDGTVVTNETAAKLNSDYKNKLKEYSVLVKKYDELIVQMEELEPADSDS